jgi:hypothetical protein
MQTELSKREFEREQRDRDFWNTKLPGEISENSQASDFPAESVTLNVVEEGSLPGMAFRSDDEVIARSPLGRR